MDKPDLHFDTEEPEDISVSSGTFCGVIGQKLVTPVCPLPNGACMWKHRQTGLCMFTTSSLNAHEFAALVGLPPLDAPTVNILRNTLKNKIYQEVAT